MGQRVALNPWLSCAPRGLPKCVWCEQGQYSLCMSFTKGSLKSGCHSGNCAGASGGFATFTPAHESMAIPIPDDIRDEQAVLADPWSVSFHGIVRNPPPEGGTALVYGCGTLGLLAIAILKHFFPNVKILAVARYEHQAELAMKLGAHRVFRSPKKNRRRVIDEIAQELKVEILEPWFGMPMLNGGVNVVYDTISSSETLEVGLRLTNSRGKIVIYGVEPAKRFEWTPLYFKEISVVGSNAYGVESFRGESKYAFEWFFEALKNGMPDVTAIISHEFPLRDYKKAFLSCRDQGTTRALKVLFRF